MHTQRETVVITGASAGVGRATVQEFARHGARVGLLARGREGLEAAKQAAERLGAEAALAVPTDVAEPEQVEAAADRVESELGPIDESQQHDGPISNDRPNNLFAPLDDDRDFGAHGDFDKRAHARSLELWFAEHRGALLLSALVAGALGARLLRSAL